MKFPLNKHGESVQLKTHILQLTHCHKTRPQMVHLKEVRRSQQQHCAWLKHCSCLKARGMV